MYILGLNLGHDLTVCIVKDGKLIYANEVERLSRKNGHTVLPEHLEHPRGMLHYIDAALENCELTLKDISYVGVSEAGYSKYAAKHLKPYFTDDKIYSTPHHECHASASYYVSPFKEASFLTIDGFGTDGNLTYGVAKDNHLKFLFKN
jgi:carbamoyltransferase